MTTLNTEYESGLRLQAEVMRDVAAYADQRMAQLPWISDQAAEVYAMLQACASAAELESLLR